MYRGMDIGGTSGLSRTGHNHSSSAPQLNSNSESTTSTREASHLCVNNLEANVTCLWLLTPLLASISLMSIIIAVATNTWLHTEEKMRNPSYNGTGERDYLSKMTVSGLWTLCYTNPGENSYYCFNIDHFSREEYSPDPNDSTMAIPYAVTRSTTFFLVATFLLCAGYCSCFIGHFARERRLFTFASGVLFIVSGLIILFGLIMYISVFKAEIGGKLRPRSQLAPPAFTYRYGYSFLLLVGGFISTKLAGISAICLFIYSYQSDNRRQRLRDLRTIKYSRTLPPVNYLHLDHVFYPCRRHPNAYIDTNSASIHIPIRYPSPSNQRRYFFNKEPYNESPCSVHRVSTSVKDLSSSFYDFPPPPPPAISYSLDNNCIHRSLSHFPRDATTNTLSTTADVNTGSPNSDHNLMDNTAHEFVTFDLGDPVPLISQVRGNVSLPPLPLPPLMALFPASQNDRPIIRTEYSVDTLRRTTPV